MSRRIETGTEEAMLGVNKTPDGALGRLIKYIPSEIIALYLGVAALVPKSDVTALWWVFGVCAVITFVYLIVATNDKKKGVLWLQVILGTIAFPVWVFAIGGPFLSLSWYKGYIASIVLAFVTFVLAKFPAPKLGS